MKRLSFIIVSVALIASLFTATSCLATQGSAFLDAGAADLTATGTQFVQYWLFRFDTATAGRTLTTPSAADIIKALQSPSVGIVIVLGVTADGANPVIIQGGNGVTVKPSAVTIAANTTLTIYCTLDNVSSGSEAITIY